MNQAYFFAPHGPLGYLSPMSPHPVTIDGTRFATITHYMAHTMLSVSGINRRLIARVLADGNVSRMRTKAFSMYKKSAQWESVKYHVVRAATVQKFESNPSLIAQLCKLDKEPVYMDSDPFWGGERNSMGRIISEVRNEFVAKYPELSQTKVIKIGRAHV